MTDFERFFVGQGFRLSEINEPWAQMVRANYERKQMVTPPSELEVYNLRKEDRWH